MTHSPVARAWETLSSPIIGIPARLRLSSRIPDLILSIVIGLNGGLTVPGASVTAGELAAAVLVVLAWTRRGEKGWVRDHRVLALIWAIALWYPCSAILNGIMPITRLGHTAVWCLLVGALGTGRIDVPASVRGCTIGLLIGIPYGVVTLNSGGYPGRLSGILGDPNAAGYYLATLGFVFYGLSRDRWYAKWIGVILGVGVVMTLSRTSMLALVVALVWMVLPARVPTWQRALLTYLLYLAGSAYANAHKNAGIFAGRTGSDDLRERLYPLEEQLVQSSQLIGHGPGTLTVNLDGADWFFHSSYLLARAEGGWILLGILVALLVAVALTTVEPASGLRNRALEASLIVPAVCGVNLGNVFLDFPFAVALGVCLWWAAAPRTDDLPPEPQDARPTQAKRRASAW